VFLRLDGDACNARFRLSYRDREYAVSNFNQTVARNPACRADAGRGSDPLAKDHTLEILAVLHQLVGINQSAADIRPTPFVQVLP
jgi:hypothetical protein